ncbi:hypothetical protein LINPERHAP2_LOCUS24585, partial [Linum perenne]
PVNFTFHPDEQGILHRLGKTKKESKSLWQKTFAFLSLAVFLPFSPFPGFWCRFQFSPIRKLAFGSNGCDTMTVTGSPLSDLQAQLSPDDVFMAIYFLSWFRFWQFAFSVSALLSCAQVQSWKFRISTHLLLSSVRRDQCTSPPANWKRRLRLNPIADQFDGRRRVIGFPSNAFMEELLVPLPVFDWLSQSFGWFIDFLGFSVWTSFCGRVAFLLSRVFFSFKLFGFYCFCSHLKPPLCSQSCSILVFILST